MGWTMIESLLSIKVVMIWAGLILVALAVGIMIMFSVHEIPAIIWCAVLSWSKPLYLHLITNAIIISIVASAHFRRPAQSDHPPGHLITVRTPPQWFYGSLSIEESTADKESDQDMIVELEPVSTAVNVIENREVLEEPKYVIIDSVPAYSWPSQEIISPEPQLQLLYPTSLGLCHGNLIKTSPQVTGPKGSCATPFPGAKTQREPEPKRGETLESIWKMITEKREAEQACAQIGNLKRTKQLGLEALPDSERAVAESRIASLKPNSSTN